MDKNKMVKIILVCFFCVILGVGYIRWLKGKYLDAVMVLLLIFLALYPFLVNKNTLCDNLKKKFILFVVASLGFFQFIDLLAIACFGFHINDVIGDAIVIVLGTNKWEVLSFIKNFKSFSFFSSLLSIIAVVCYFTSFKFKNIEIKNKYINKITFPLILTLLAGLFVSPKFAIRELILDIPGHIGSVSNAEEYSKIKEKFFWNAKSTISGKSTVVVVLGETTRADHMSINGYQRNTNPLLSQEELISFSNAISNSVHTLGATPYIMTRKPVTDKWVGLNYPEKSLFSAFKEAGYKTYYISNVGNFHLGDNAINLIVNEADEYIQRPYGDEDTMKDGAGLPYIEKILKDDKDEKKIIVFKLEGSHWHFQDRYPKEYDVFQPSFKTVEFNGPNIEQKDIFINTFDNSMLYTDFIVDSIIELLKKEDGEVAFSFISDHGIAIYEDNKSLYGGFIKANYNIAYFYWFNDLVKKRLGEKCINMLKSNIDKPVDQTYFIDTLFDVSGIKSEKRVGRSLFDTIQDVDDRKVLKGKSIVFYRDI